MLPAIKGSHPSGQRSTSSLDHSSRPKAHPSGQRSTSSLDHHTKAQGWVRSAKANSGVGRRSHSVEPDTEAGAPTRMAHGPSLSQRMAAWRGDDLETDLRSLEQFVQSALTFEDAVRRHNGAQQRRHPVQTQSMAIASSSPSPSPVMPQPRRGELFDTSSGLPNDRQRNVARSRREDAGMASEDVFAKKGILRATDTASGGAAVEGRLKPSHRAEEIEKLSRHLEMSCLPSPLTSSPFPSAAMVGEQVGTREHAERTQANSKRASARFSEPPALPSASPHRSPRYCGCKQTGLHTTVASGCCCAASLLVSPGCSGGSALGWVTTPREGIRPLSA